MSILRIGRRAGAALTTSGLLVALSTTALAESGYSSPITLRTGPAGAAVHLWDIAVAGRDIAVIWEERLGDGRVVRLRTSRDGGRTFRAQRLVDGRGAYEGGTDVCAGYAWVANNFTLPDDPEGSWGLVVHGMPLNGTGRSREVIVGAGGSHNVGAVDLACARGRRRVVAWTDQDSQRSSTIRLRFLPVLPGTEGVDEVDLSFRGSESSSVALAAVRDRVWVTWVSPARRRIRVRAFDIGPAPDYAVTPALSLSLPEVGQNAFRSTLGAAGSRVIIAYSVESGAYTRTSTDGGATFGPRRRLLRGRLADVSWSAHAADTRGRRAVVHAGMSGGMEGEFSTVMYRYRSFDGRSWSRVRRYTDGARMGAFSVTDGAARLVEAWDQSASSKPRKWLRFHREIREHPLE